MWGGITETMQSSSKLCSCSPDQERVVFMAMLICGSLKISGHLISMASEEPAGKEPMCPSGKHFKLQPVKLWSLLWGHRSQAGMASLSLLDMYSEDWSQRSPRSTKITTNTVFAHFLLFFFPCPSQYLLIFLVLTGVSLWYIFLPVSQC